MLPRDVFKRAVLCTILGLAAVLPALSASAAAKPAVKESVIRLIQTEASRAPEFRDVKIDVELLATGAQLPACQKPQAFFPHQQQQLRPGRMTLGLRCEGEPDRYIPVRLVMHGPYLEVSRSLKPGDTLDEQSIRVSHGNLGDLPADVLRKREQALGKQAVRRLEPGTALRGNHVRSRPLVKRGQNVAVESRGRGFVVKRDGVAMENGGVGDTVRVRLSQREILEAQVTENGRLVLNH